MVTVTVASDTSERVIVQKFNIEVQLDDKREYKVTFNAIRMAIYAVVDYLTGRCIVDEHISHDALEREIDEW